MINNIGVWTAETDYNVYPKEKWHDMDIVANYIQEQNYIPKTDMENLVNMLVLHFESETEDSSSWYFPTYDDDLHINIKGLSEFVEASGGLKEFDYYC